MSFFQNIEPGTEVDLKAEIVLTVSTGPAEESPPPTDTSASPSVDNPWASSDNPMGLTAADRFSHIAVAAVSYHDK